jgi:uncharacterized repeat protein (TIGR03803 family)
MKRAHRSWILGFHRRVAIASLALAIVLVPAVSTIGSTESETFTVLHSFTGGTSGDDGASPIAGVIRDAAGNIYGTTNRGGPFQVGTVFKVDVTGKESVLYSFTGGADGDGPSGLIRDATGNLYGTTRQGGASNCGTVFKLDKANKETTLYTFTGRTDGCGPFAGLIRDSAGNLYGTTLGGGAMADCGGYGCGVVFKLDTTGKETALYSFSGGADGSNPEVALIRDSAGNMYGIANGGGDLTCNAPYGCGVVFRVDATGKETVLYTFTGGADGAMPLSSLLRDASGNLYGTILIGSTRQAGAVFKVNAKGKETVLYNFTGGADGGYSYGNLIQDGAGNLYGTTNALGTSGFGTIFKLDPLGNLTTLHSFTGGADGGNSYAGLLRDAAGNLYGTANYGGSGGVGTVFELQMAATTTTLSSLPNPSTYGQAVTFTAVISSGAGAPPDGESVTFMKGTTVLGTGGSSGGSASFTTSTLPVATSTIKAVYDGDSNFEGSTSKAVSQVVSKATTTTTLASSRNPSSSGQSVTFTASVTPQFSGTVKGTVTFYDGTTALKTLSLSGGVTKFTTSTLSSGTHGITATYNGNTNFIGSSASLTQTVN